MAHAYLFIGPEGCGKLAMALEIARILNCTEAVTIESLQGCDCKSCDRIRRWQHPNLYPVFPLPRLDKLDKNKVPVAQSVLQDIITRKTENIYTPLILADTGRILTDQIHDLRSKLSLIMDRPGVRVIIVHPSERLRDEPANAFLRLLEEPPDKCCLILTAESTRDLLPTIVSRCQTIKFAPLTREEIKEEIVNRWHKPAEIAETAARLSGGSFSRAISLLQGDASDQLSKSLEFLRAAVMGNAEKITEIVESWSNRVERMEAKEKMSYTSFWIKDAMIWKALGEENALEHLSITNQDNVIEKMAVRYSDKQLSSIWQALEETRRAIDDNCIIPLALTALALKINRILK